MHSSDPRISWRKAIVIQLIASEDGAIRKCLVKTSTGETIRAIKHLYPLEINVEDHIDHIKESKLAEPVFSQICDNQNQGYSRFFSAKIKAISRSFLKFSFSQ